MWYSLDDVAMLILAASHMESKDVLHVCDGARGFACSIYVVVATVVLFAVAVYTLL